MYVFGSVHAYCLISKVTCSAHLTVSHGKEDNKGGAKLPFILLIFLTCELLFKQLCHNASKSRIIGIDCPTYHFLRVFATDLQPGSVSSLY